MFGKKNFIINKEVPKIYLISLGVKYISDFLRFYLIKFLFKKTGKRAYIGKKTEIVCKKKICLGDNVRIGNYTKINSISEEGLSLGNNVKIGEYSSILLSGGINNLGKGMSIGKNSFFSEYTFFGAAGGIKIGEDVISGQYVRFHAENHLFNEIDKLIKEQGVTRKGIVIGDNCWIGAGAVFLDGAELGNGCVVAANSVVTKKFPSNSVVAGVPAKILRYR
ncbi:transferase [Liquorilactobacillus hordei]|nr:transferase [Liquorilactobacillus hordei]